ncbi:MAG: sigma factor [Anaerolineae bacterium]
MEKQALWLDKFIIGRVAQATEAEVFADLYRAHTYAVFNYCLFRVNDAAVAEDLTADTFERAWRARNSYRPDQANFNTWLFTICRHVVTDMAAPPAAPPIDHPG